MSAEPLSIRRGTERLVVKPRDGGGFDLVASGGGNIRPDELQAIEAYVAGKPGAEPFLEKLRRRMDR